MSPSTSTTYSCSILAASAVNLRRIFQSWVNTNRPLALACRSALAVRRRKWPLSGRLLKRCSSDRVSALIEAIAVSASIPTGASNRMVTGSGTVALASESSSTFWVVILNCGSSITSPSTETQPPSINSSASRREQPTSSIRRLERRMGSVMTRAVAKGGGYCTCVGAVNPGPISAHWLYWLVHGSKCGSGLARECGGSASTSLTDTPHSRASPLPHWHCVSSATAPLLLAQTHVQQRVRLAQAIMLRASDYLEPLLEVKAQGLWVLFVDVQCIGVHVLDRIAQQLPAEALAAVLRVDKQHLDFTRGHPGKPGNTLARVFGADQHDGVQVTCQHQFLKQHDVAVRQEVVGRAHGRFPDLRQLREVADFRCVDNRMLTHARCPLPMIGVDGQTIDLKKPRILFRSGAFSIFYSLNRAFQPTGRIRRRLSPCTRPCRPASSRWHRR